jgi:hypothetical protein
MESNPVGGNTPNAEKLKVRCTATACGKSFLVPVARWKEGITCPLCKQGKLTKVLTSPAPVPVAPAKVVAPPPAPAPAPAVPIVPVRHIPDPRPSLPVATVVEAPEDTVSGPLPVAAVRYVPDSSPKVEWLPGSQPSSKVPPPVVLPMAEEWQEDKSEEGTYGLVGVKSPPNCPKCRTKLKPCIERCPRCHFDFRGDWETRLEKAAIVHEEIEQEERERAIIRAYHGWASPEEQE